MTITRMPAGWVVDDGAGELGVDVDFDTSTFNTGGQSLKFLATGTTTRVFSHPFPVGVDASAEDSVRRKLGWTINHAYSGTAPASPPYELAATDVGVYWYDASGVYISKSTKLLRVFAGAGAFETDGAVVDVPSSPSVAQYARLVIEYTNASQTLSVDHMTPYAMPPFGEATFSGTQSLATVGSWVAIPLTLVSAGSGVVGSHALRQGLFNTDLVAVRETGSYTVEARVFLDSFVGDQDAFLISIVTGNPTGRYVGQLFSPAVSSASMTFPSGAGRTLATTKTMPLPAGAEVGIEVVQTAGTAVNAIEAALRITKEN